MGRPLNKKYFGNRNTGSASVTTDNGLGGKRIASVTIGGSWAGFTALTTTVTFTAPELPGGVTATGTAVINGGGAVTGVIMTEKGSGYISLPTVTIADSDGGAETTGTATAVFEVDSGAVGSSTNQENAVRVTAYIPASGTAGYISGAGGSSAVAGDIVRQVGSNKYVVKTAQGVGRCTLVTDGAANAAGEMNITAVDAGGKTYYVAKLTAHRARLVPYGAAGHIYSSGQTAPWSLDAASGLYIQIVNA